MMLQFAKPYDALVVGARAAGAATAMLMARAGMRVLVIDWDEPGTDTMSTHALMRGAVSQLARWQLLDPLRAAGTPDVTRTTFFYGSETVPVPIKPAFGAPGLIAPRRYLLDETLARAARSHGADLRYRTAFRDVIRDHAGRVVGARLEGADGQSFEVAARLVIGADGRRSAVARRAGARTIRSADATTACAYAYFGGMRDEGYRWYFSPGLGTGAIPTNDRAHCVFAAAKPFHLRTMLREHGPAETLIRLCAESNRELGAELREATLQSTPVVFGGEPGFFREASGPGWALVGDAGYFKDPLTAHGITDALRDAEILARAAIRGGDRALAEYGETRNALSNDLFDVTCDIARLDLTMDKLKAAHVRLNAAMKAEQAWMTESFGEHRAAA